MPATAATEVLTKGARVPAGKEAQVKAEFNQVMMNERSRSVVTAQGGLDEESNLSSTSVGPDGSLNTPAKSQTDNAFALDYDDEADEQAAAEEEEEALTQARIADTYRQAIQVARQTKAGVSAVASEAAEVATNMATGKLLQQYWINMPETFGLTIILIDIHIFLWLVLGKKYFCPLGSEWSIGGGKNIGVGAAGARPAFLGAAEGEAAILEWIIVLILNLILLAVILFDIVIYGMAIYSIVHPLETMWKLLDFIIT